MISQHVHDEQYDKQIHLILGFNSEDIDRLTQGHVLVLPSVSGLRVTMVYGKTNREQADRVECIANTDPSGDKHWENRWL